MDELNFFPVKENPIKGSTFSIVNKRARAYFRDIEKKTKRKPFIRSAYFGKEKIFFDFFFSHLNQKGRKTKMKRLQLLPCMIELIENTLNSPYLLDNPVKKSEILFRFGGVIKSTKKKFIVQIKSTKKKEKFFMSVFEYNKKLFNK